MDAVNTAPDAMAFAIRLGLAVLAGAVLGLDRELKRKPAGLRTHALVSVGSAMVVLVILATGGGPGSDPLSRAVQGVITGIGFLGAGVIMRGAGGELRGLTTAASLWAMTGIGVAVGSGHEALAVLLAALVYLVAASGDWPVLAGLRRRASGGPTADHSDQRSAGVAVSSVRTPAPAERGSAGVREPSTAREA